MPRWGRQKWDEDSTQWVEELIFLDGISAGKKAVEGVEGVEGPFPLIPRHGHRSILAVVP